MGKKEKLKTPTILTTIVSTAVGLGWKGWHTRPRLNMFSLSYCECACTYCRRRTTCVWMCHVVSPFSPTKGHYFYRWERKTNRKRKKKWKKERKKWKKGLLTSELGQGGGETKNMTNGLYIRYSVCLFSFIWQWIWQADVIFTRVVYTTRVLGTGWHTHTPHHICCTATNAVHWNGTCTCKCRRLYFENDGKFSFIIVLSRVGKERWPSCRFLEPNEHRRLVATGRNRAITDKVYRRNQIVRQHWHLLLPPSL